MKISENTITILKNFQTINPSIQFEKGSLITTKSPTSTIFASSKIQEEFPITFAIYDLRKLLSLFSMSKNSEIDYNETYLTIYEGKKKIKYSYCSPETIVIPEKKPSKLEESEIFQTFELTSDMLRETISAMNVLQHDGILIKGDEGKLLINTASNSSEDSFSLEIGETDKEFSFMFESSKLNVLPKDYKVSLSKKKFMHLEHDNIQYWIASNFKSSMSD